MEIPGLSRQRYVQAVVWTILVCGVIVSVAATLARATLNLSAAVFNVEKPNIAVYVLDRNIVKSQLIRAGKVRMDYLATMQDGSTELIVLRYRNNQWQIDWREKLHESGER